MRRRNSFPIMLKLKDYCVKLQEKEKEEGRRRKEEEEEEEGGERRRKEEEGGGRRKRKLRPPRVLFSWSCGHLLKKAIWLYLLFLASLPLTSFLYIEASSYYHQVINHFEFPRLQKAFTGSHSRFHF